MDAMNNGGTGQIEMKTKWFFSVWLVSSIMMYGLSFVWHGVLLNDYMSIKYPMWMYFTLAAVVYLVIGFVLTYLYHYTYTHRIKYKGMLLGACLGFFIYLMAFVLGVSFNPNSLEHTVVDFLWQMFEQGVGGAAIGAVMRFLVDMDRFEKADA